MIYAISWGVVFILWAFGIFSTAIFFTFKWSSWVDEKEMIDLFNDFAKKQRKEDFDKMMDYQAMKDAAKIKLLDQAREELKARKADRIEKDDEKARLAEEDVKKNNKKKKEKPLPKAARKAPLDVLVQSTYSKEADKKIKKKKSWYRRRSTDTFDATQNTVSQATEDQSVSQEPTITSKLLQPNKGVDSKMSMTTEPTNNTEAANNTTEATNNTTEVQSVTAG